MFKRNQWLDVLRSEADREQDQGKKAALDLQVAWFSNEKLSIAKIRELANERRIALVKDVQVAHTHIALAESDVQLGKLQPSALDKAVNLYYRYVNELARHGFFLELLEIIEEE